MLCARIARRSAGWPGRLATVDWCRRSRRASRRSGRRTRSASSALRRSASRSLLAGPVPPAASRSSRRGVADRRAGAGRARRRGRPARARARRPDGPPQSVRGKPRSRQAFAQVRRRLRRPQVCARCRRTCHRRCGGARRQAGGVRQRLRAVLARRSGQAECASGDVASPTTVVLFGDSHAAMWDPALNPVAEQQHWRLETLAKVTCPLLDLPIVSPYLGRQIHRVRAVAQSDGSARLMPERPGLVVLEHGPPLRRRFRVRVVRPGVARCADAAGGRDPGDTGANVLVLGPVPDPQSVGADVPVGPHGRRVRLLAAAGGRVGRRRHRRLRPRRYRRRRRGITRTSTELFCTGERCPVIVGNTWCSATTTTSPSNTRRHSRPSSPRWPTGHLHRADRLRRFLQSHPVRVSHSAGGRCSCESTTTGGEHGQQTRIPKAELTGIYGAIVKRMSARCSARWPNRSRSLAQPEGAQFIFTLGRQARKWDACDKTLKSFAHMAVAAGRMQLLPGLRLLPRPQRGARRTKHARCPAGASRTCSPRWSGTCSSTPKR